MKDDAIYFLDKKVQLGGGFGELESCYFGALKVYKEQSRYHYVHLG